ncbi:MAG: nitrite transporter [Actinomycetota bacterium]
MPVPIPEALAANYTAASTKADEVRSNLPRFMASAGAAGAFVGLAIVLLIAVGSAFVAAQSPAVKLVQGSVFGLALVLVVFAGAELFTGNVMVMIQGLMARKVRTLDLALVWIASLVGNLLGSIGLAALVNASGIFSTGATPGQPTIFFTALSNTIKAKVALSGGQLFFRSILCNALVCLALWMATRTKSDATKIIVMWFALLAFIASGFEHSIANMTVFSLGIFGHAPLATWGEMLRNLAYTVPGNVVGGGLLIGAFYGSYGSRATTPETADAPIDELTLDVRKLSETPELVHASAARA